MRNKLIEADYIFQQIKQDSKTDGQVITETNYIIDELKDYTKLYAEALKRCRYCGGNLQLIDNKEKELLYLECEECKRINK